MVAIVLKTTPARGTVTADLSKKPAQVVSTISSASDVNQSQNKNSLKPGSDSNPRTLDVSSAIIAAIIAGAVAFVTSVVTAIINVWYYRRQLRQKDTEQEIKRIQHLLDTFYGPFKTLKKTNTNLERLLKLKQTEEGPVRAEWRTLKRLLDGHKFTENEKVLIETIIMVDGQLDDLIGRCSGLITDPELQDEVNTFRAHYRVIKAAYDGKLHNEFWRFQDYVYPRGLNDLIDRETQRLQRYLTSLQGTKL